ncbi:MAG TPA: glycosyl hydrolase 115 family protein [Verrucomicrobiae bacterium]|nr:glycosyl hydrolase 115 family protein [Verrucomicrobiae bacterium]
MPDTITCNACLRPLRLLASLLLAVTSANTVLALGESNYVFTAATRGSFTLVDGRAAPIIVDTNDFAGVLRAAGDLRKDVERVTGARAQILHRAGPESRTAVIIGTAGKSPLIDTLVRDGKIDVSDIAGKWEAFFLQVVPQPMAGLDNALVICGSDKRGTIYGIYDLCEKIGVSPWHFWGDSPVARHGKLFISPGKFVQGPPSVKYRGIFINDEAPALTEWVRAQYGDVPGRRGVANYGRGFYTNIFEVMLRLRANYLWPAMWNNAFNEDDPENPRLADEYGIVMGTSHQEPMLRAQQEWDRGFRQQHGLWDYNKTNQRPALHDFWRAGIRRNKAFESIITLGLRAENDSGAPVGRELTEEIISIQRRILAEELTADVTKIPQMWCLYKEVQAYYEEGLRVPDDVTLLWAEDNWGNIRRLPTANERGRSGGAGIYYHFDYHGGPRSYQWINTSPIPKIWDQMSLAAQYGADRIWIVNVGHFNKGSEFPLEFFLRLAWNTSRWTHENLDEFTRLWAEREFGKEHAVEIADLIATYTRFNGRRKPELLEPETYSLLNYREFESVVAEYQALSDRAEKVFNQLEPRYRDAFYGFVLYPVKACAGLNAMYFAAGRNALHARQGRASANDSAAETRKLFATQTNLVHHFNHIYAGGRWNHFMDQAYIGYTSWNPPRQNNLNAIKLAEVTVPDAARMGVAVEGSMDAAGGTLKFHRHGQASRYVEVFNGGKTPFEFSADVRAPWIVLDDQRGTVEKDRRIELRIDWNKTVQGENSGVLVVHGAGTNFVVNIRAVNPAQPASETADLFIEADGFVSIEAEHFSRNTDAGTNRWIRVSNYGHTLSGMRADAPPGALATPGKDSPCLEYRMHLSSSGEVEVESIVGPTLGFIPGRPIRYAVSFDDQAPREVTIVPAPFEGHYTNPRWSDSVRNNCHKVKSKHLIQSPGEHTLKIWMIDPAVVLQKHIVNFGGALPSYLGPPESLRGSVRSQASSQFP